MVSHGDSSGVIPFRIIKNLKECDIVVADVSGSNPNVMYEVGLRMAFDKPIVLVSDDVGRCPFDTRTIEHIGYLPNVRYLAAREFIERLAKKIQSTVAQRDTWSILGQFGVVPSSLDVRRDGDESSTSVALDRLWLEMTKLRHEVNALRPDSPPAAKRRGGLPIIVALGKCILERTPEAWLESDSPQLRAHAADLLADLMAEDPSAYNYIHELPYRRQRIVNEAVGYAVRIAGVRAGESG